MAEIHDGINAISLPGRVHVAAANYPENITMRSSVEVLRAGRDATTVGGGGSGSMVTVIDVDDMAKLDGFAITNAAARADTGSIIGDLIDPENLDIDAFVDILSARIAQDGGLLTFVIETRGDIPTTLARPEDSITYLWFVDADNDPNTGQPQGDVGSEFNVRAVISELHGGGSLRLTVMRGSFQTSARKQLR